MQQFYSSNTLIGQALDIPRSDRWRIYQRLQELTIPCACPADGSLRVDINHGIALVLVRSTMRQFIAPRQELVNWLERCLHTNVVCKQNH
jgi:hypothetical protein